MNFIKRLLFVLIILVVLLVAVVLSSLNADKVRLNIYLFEFDWPLGFLLMVFLITGFFGGLLVSMFSWVFPAKRQAGHWKRQYYLETKKSEAGTTLKTND